jgi:hypothetical protein
MTPVIGQRAFSKYAFFKWIGYEVYTEDVARFHNSNARTRIMSAPARTSKSYSAAAEAAFDAFPNFYKAGNNRRAPMSSKLIWIVGPDYDTAKEFDYVYKWLVDDREKLGFDYRLTRAKNNPKQGDRQIVIEWGRDPNGDICRTVIKGMTAERERALQGEEIDHAIMSEAAELPERILTKYLATRSHRLTLPTTPKPHANWIKELIDIGEADPSLGIDHFHYAIYPEIRRAPNPKFDWKRFDEEQRRAEARTPTGKAEDDPFFAEQFLGLWVYYTGRVLPNFRREASIPGKMCHIIDRFPNDIDAFRKFVSIDYGHDHPSAVLFWAVCPDGTLLICDELVKAEIAPETLVREIQAKVETLGWEPDYYVGDPSRPEVETIMRDFGLPVFRPQSKNAMRDRAAGTLLLINYLHHDEELKRPKLFVHRQCRHVITEWTTLRRRENYTGDEFGKAAFDPTCRDDTFDAARYGLMSRIDPYQPEKQRRWWEDFERERVRRGYESANYRPSVGAPIGPSPERFSSVIAGRAA